MRRWVVEMVVVRYPPKYNVAPRPLSHHHHHHPSVLAQSIYTTTAGSTGIRTSKTTITTRTTTISACMVHPPKVSPSSQQRLLLLSSPKNRSHHHTSVRTLYRYYHGFRDVLGRKSFHPYNTTVATPTPTTTTTTTTNIAAAAAAVTMIVSYWMMMTTSMSHRTTSTTLLEPQHGLVTDQDDPYLRQDCATTTNDVTDTESSTSTTTTIYNWSGTHSVQVPNDHYWEPETVEDVVTIVQAGHERGVSVRPIGSALSPNGIGFSETGMISLLQLDQIIQIDSEQSTVTVQAGARVEQVIEALRPYHYTLPNLASIAEQQMGGFVQVGAHGTGRTIAPIDHYVTQLKLVTPAHGIMTLTEQDGELFHMAKVGLGCLGVVVEVTMKCIPAHYLREHTFVLTRQEAKEQLDTLLKEHRHMRYMWIPYTDTVVCVTNDPVEIDPHTTTSSIAASPSSPPESKSSHFWFRQNKETPVTDTKPFQNQLSMEERLQPMVDLLLQIVEEERSLSTTTDPIYTHESVRGMGFAALRDAILAWKDPLDISHVQRCNTAEAEFWKRNEGYVIKPSDQLLQFDCGGQQWVWEVCFPTGTQECNNGNDIRFMEHLLEGIESQNIPAHAPIEQRWSASSSSYMSPAYGPADGLHCWVGIINYLPSSDGVTTTPEQEMLRRQDITAQFTGPYCDLMRQVGKEVNATSHWAKLEVPKSLWALIDLQLFLNTRFPLDQFNAWREQLDPKNILASPQINMLLGKPKPPVNDPR